jgi:hypothetical protein
MYYKILSKKIKIKSYVKKKETEKINVKVQEKTVKKSKEESEKM